MGRTTVLVCSILEHTVYNGFAYPQCRSAGRSNVQRYKDNAGQEQQITTGTGIDGYAVLAFRF